ncbi:MULTISPECIES: hypothetical protein [unclassified Bosea (in: a-proteobacteria)]|uniref:hypothetical protein n=1 Tax=unclassified Bosea (in: a-proteobacteria) TaxID=2653178 RepID=UPI000F7E4E00|nr:MULTISPECIES: hypothetical protein [unclassified Bosea (in: a-proteobacteria)]MCV9937403.1 hypothetical protein [Boseaceae bacterium BT-24-1]RXT16662.1 hypothetical protein B5U98_27425 [Bosea sp. Tri-39]RXT42417.1 hypothetical protein B5U99_00495 [Bosea sp. Tri-54]
MSTSTKSPTTIRQGGPGASHENAKAPKVVTKPRPESEQRRHSTISGGGGERDEHHTRDPEQKGGRTRPAN